ncbi:MAG: amidohydrolase family protein [Gemmatimonadaceae bacterium]
MNRLAIAVAILAASGCSGSRQPTTAITHVSVVDVVAGTTRADNTVIIHGNRIVYVGAAANANIPDGARLVDGRGKFLIPGLWDMHVHAFMYVFSDFAGPLMIANGVTGARDMGYHVDTTLRWKREIAAGLEVGPRLVAGVRVDGPVGRASFVSHIKDSADAVKAVDTLARSKSGSQRSDFISVDPLIPRAAYFAMARESRRLGLPFAGKVPYSVSVVEASDSGQRSIEQEDDLMRACSATEGAFRAQLADTTNRRAGDDPLQPRDLSRQILASLDPARCRSLFATLVRNHTWVTPTLVAYQPYARSFDSASTHPEWSKYVPGIVQGGWLQKAAPAARPDSITVRSSFSFERTGALDKAGVGLLAGTDAPRAFLYPGFSLHEELSLLVRSGLTPAEALRTATYNPAAYLGSLDSLGTVEQGKIADLVLLDANPLVDIHNTRRISTVVANGRVFDAAARASLLNRVQTALKP